MLPANLASLPDQSLAAAIEQERRAGRLIAVCMDGSDEPPFAKGAAAATPPQSGKASRAARHLADVRRKLPGISEQTARVIVSLRDPAALNAGLPDPRTGKLEDGIRDAAERRARMRGHREEVLGLIARKFPDLSHPALWEHASRLAPELFQH